MEQAALRNIAPPRHAQRFFGYVTIVVLTALAVLGWAFGHERFGYLTSAAFWTMAGLAVLVDAKPFTAPAQREQMPIFPSTCFTFAILLGWGLAPAAAVQVLAVAVSSLLLRHTPWRAAFNAGQYVVAFGAASFVLELHGHEPRLPTSLGEVTVMLIAAVCWFIVNNALVTTAVWLRFGGSWLRGFGHAVEFDSLATGALLFSAPALVAGAHATAWLVPLMLAPIYAVGRMSVLADARARSGRIDPLTGLANRRALELTVAGHLTEHEERAAGGAPERRLALLLIDLNGFKKVNDALGHHVGDRLLTEVGHRLTEAAHPDFVARLGGDEFAVLVPALRDVAGARQRAAEIMAALDEPVTIDGLHLDVSASVGVAVYPEHGDEFAALMQHADVAMYDAKNRGDSVAVYAPESDHNSAERLELLADLRRALESPDGPGITLYYQPQVAIPSGEVVGLEALLRWRHPKRGAVDPEELIRVAEHSSVMRLLTLRVIDDVIAQLAAWGPIADRLRVAVNVSVRDLHTGEIADRIAEKLREHSVDPSRLELEITESALMADPRRVLATLARLRKLGIAIALDDFGTGYSSMQHLRRLPLAEVKIDRSFVLGVCTDPDDAAIVRSMIDLARALGLRVVAEGVEDESTWRMLAEAGCDVAQGWYFARPMPGEQLVDWLARHRPRAAHTLTHQ